MKSSDLLTQQTAIEAKSSLYEQVLQGAERTASGLTLDAAKTPEWREAKRLWNMYWAQYRKVNKQLSKMRKLSHYEIIDGKRFAVYKYKD